MQRRLTEKAIDINRNSRTKEGFAQSMKRLFWKYGSMPFFYNVNTPDFQSFVSKKTLSVTCDYFTVFYFMVDSLAADIFE